MEQLTFNIPFGSTLYSTPAESYFKENNIDFSLVNRDNLLYVARFNSREVLVAFIDYMRTNHSFIIHHIPVSSKGKISDC